MPLTLTVHYEDSDILAIEKPAGLLSVPGRGIDKSDSVETRVRAQIAGAAAIHRLDMATSGIILIAKHKAAERHYKIQFEQRLVEKTYHAITDGIITADNGSMDWRLIVDWDNRPRQKVCAKDGKDALTHYQVLKRDTTRSQTLVMLTPITGRSHQLRVHLATLGHPIIGDELYGNENTNAARLLLHANKLSCNKPNGERLTILSPLPFSLNTPPVT